MTKTYSLRLYDTELVKFKLGKDYENFQGLQAEIICVNSRLEKLFPLDLSLTNDGILNWLKHRVIPKNRMFVEEILTSMNLSPEDTQGIIDVCKGLSLNDSYWIVPDGFSGKFADYNLYENRFSEALSLIAYTGVGNGDFELTTSPEFTTNGILPKAWRFIDGIYLYKGGSSGASNTGREPYCEYYASQIAETMGLNAVHYDLEKWKGIVASKCRLFTDINTSYIPIGRIVKTGGIKACLDFYDGLGEIFGEQIRSMLVFDALTYNTDRHFDNFGVLRDNRTGEIIAPAPIFDNGLSLLCYAGRADVDNLEKMENYAKTRATPYGYSFDEIAGAVIGKKQKEQLRRMINFTFTRHRTLNFSENHLRTLERLLQTRTQQLLHLPIGKYSQDMNTTDEPELAEFNERASPMLRGTRDRDRDER